MPDYIRYRKDKKGFTTLQNYWISKYEKQLNKYVEIVAESNFSKYLPANGKFQDHTKYFRTISFGAWLKHFQL